MTISHIHPVNGGDSVVNNEPIAWSDFSVLSLHLSLIKEIPNENGEIKKEKIEKYFQVPVAAHQQFPFVPEPSLQRETCDLSLLWKL